MTRVEALSHHLHSAPARPSERNPRVPASLERVVLRCLEKDPNRRFASARELFAELGAITDAGRWDEDAAATGWETRGAEILEAIHAEQTAPSGGEALLPLAAS